MSEGHSKPLKDAITYFEQTLQETYPDYNDETRAQFDSRIARPLINGGQITISAINELEEYVTQTKSNGMSDE